MRALVTGATGFIGANVVRELLSRGSLVRALVRKTSSLANLEGLDVDVTYGDVCDEDCLKPALAGCDALFHVAASYSFWTPRPDQVYETNVRGTENILRAAAAAGIRRVVYTSTESTVGIPPGCTEGTEELTAEPDTLMGHYKKSKHAAEQLALRMAADGLPLVVVNPTTPIGPYDVRPTPTGRMVVDFLNGRMPAYVNTGLNIVHVRDVAVGHVLAFEKGRTGERYILGNRNMSYSDIMATLAQVTGLRAPRLRIPIWLALAAGYVDESVSGRLLGKPPRVPVAAVKTARKHRYFDCRKAVADLGMPQTPVEEAFRSAVGWFVDHGYVSHARLDIIRSHMAMHGAMAHQSG
ncbi:MAG: hopanoid-associated sugar epimerase, partial [Chloroflexota bacterium]